PLVRLFVQEINGGPQLSRYAALANLLHDADDRVPIALVTSVSELESFAERGAPREVAVRERLVDNGGRHARPALGWTEIPALAELCADGRKVIAARHTKQCDLTGNVVVGLTGELVECRLAGVRHRNSRNRSGVDHPWDGTNSFQFGFDESHPFIESRITKQRALEGQQFFAPDTKIELPEMLKGFQQQTTARQQQRG